MHSGALLKHNNKLPDDGLLNRNMWEHFNVNFDVSFNIFVQQSSCAFRWINKRHDNIKIHDKTVKKKN